MFDFENLEVHKKMRVLNHEILKFLRENKNIDYFLQDQLKRASISMVINVAEGSGKSSKPDKRNFYTIARGSVYECVALLGIIQEEYGIKAEVFDNFYQKFETISKMLSGLINSQR
jgi:four helix bundle protein